MERPHIIERAFELAGQSGSIEAIRRGLRQEGYSNVDAHLSGQAIKDQLKRKLDPKLVEQAKIQKSG